MSDLIPKTAKEALKRWDAGDTVFSIEMGGLGPGYEMAIQGLCFELLRAWLKFRWPKAGKELHDDFRKTVDAVGDEVVRRCDDLPWGGFSGAQVGAAKTMAACYLRTGYAKSMESAELHDRRIQVSKHDLRK